MKTMTEAEAIEYIRTNAGSLNYENSECFAVRGDNFIPAKKFRNSWNRPDGIKTTRMNGVCACFVAKNDMFGEYENIDTLPDTKCYGKNRFLLKGELIESGNDEWDGEVVLGKHSIIAIIK